VDRDVDSTIEERLLDLPDEEPLAPEIGQRDVLPLVTGCLDRDDLDRDLRRGFPEERGDHLGLAERQLAPPRADPEPLSHL
jgi:hypothetical protein